MKKIIAEFFVITLFLISVCHTFNAANSEILTLKNKNDVLPIAFATDNAYVYATLVAMDSVMESKNKTTYINFHIMVSGSLSEENKARIISFEKFYGDCSVELNNMKDRFEDAYLCGHKYVTTPAFYRLALPSLLPQYDKILYLDGDIVVRKDLKKLFDTDIKDFLIGGVMDYSWITYAPGGPEKYAKKMGIKDLSQYINSGILLINSEKIRQNQLENNFNDYAKTLKERGVLLPDQDLLNAVCYEKIKLLSPEYNAMQHFVFSYDSMPTLVDCYNWNEWKTACENPAIVHFPGAQKPWNTYRRRFYNDWDKCRKNVEKNFYKPPIKNGIYKILSKVGKNKSIDINGGSCKNEANVQLWNANNANSQKFKIKYVNEGCCEIEALCSGKVLDVCAAGKEDGTNVWQYEKNGTDAQKWLIKDAGNGYCYFVSKCNGLYLDVEGAKTRNGTNIRVCNLSGGESQKFKIIKV